jgi:hypothetical protein
MTLSTLWVLSKGSLINVGLGVLLAIAGLALLDEYRRLFFEDPRAAMSAEVLFAIIMRSGGPGYLAAFLLAGAMLSFALAISDLIFNISSYLHATAL